MPLAVCRLASSRATKWRGDLLCLDASVASLLRKDTPKASLRIGIEDLQQSNLVTARNVVTWQSISNRLPRYRSQ